MDLEEGDTLNSLDKLDDHKDVRMDDPSINYQWLVITFSNENHTIPEI